MMTFVLYGMVSLIAAAALQPPVANFSNWDPSFPLLVGNERTGDRPWQGSISDLYIANQAISESEVEQIFTGKEPAFVLRKSLQAAYQLTGTGNYRDKTGTLPDLIWQGTAPQRTTSQATEPVDPIATIGAPLSAEHWLMTGAEVAAVNHQLQATSQFTLITTFAAANTTQNGPSRMISISSDRSSRNLTLGQQGQDLVLRLRTPLTGANGNRPELIFPGIFTDTQPHRLILAYNASVLKLYLDNLQTVYTGGFVSNMGLSQLWAALRSSNQPHTALTQIFFKLAYNAVMLIPLGALLGLLLNWDRRSRPVGSRLTWLLWSCSLLPSMVLEVFLSQLNGTAVSLENLLIGGLFTLGTMMWVSDRTPARSKLTTHQT